MLLGGSKHTIDAKGRIIFPIRFKEDMWEDIIICRGTEKCLMMFNPEGWKRFSAMIQDQPYSVAVKLQRFFFSTAAQCSVDAQGRLLLPQQLREFAGLQKEIYLNGRHDCIEVWDPEEWQKDQAMSDEAEIKSLLNSIQ